jgi:hypothetical protein
LRALVGQTRDPPTKDVERFSGQFFRQRRAVKGRKFDLVAESAHQDAALDVLAAGW